MGGFNPAWFLAVAAAVVLTLITAGSMSSRIKLALRLLAGICSLIGIVGLGIDFHQVYEIRSPLIAFQILFARRGSKLASASIPDKSIFAAVLIVENQKLKKELQSSFDTANSLRTELTHAKNGLLQAQREKEAALNEGYDVEELARDVDDIQEAQKELDTAIADRESEWRRITSMYRPDPHNPDEAILLPGIALSDYLAAQQRYMSLKTEEAAARAKLTEREGRLRSDKKDSGR